MVGYQGIVKKKITFILAFPDSEYIQNLISLIIFFRTNETEWKEILLLVQLTIEAFVLKTEPKLHALKAWQVSTWSRLSIL